MYTGLELLPSHITVVDDARGKEGGEGVEYFRVLSPPRVASDGAHVQRKGFHKTSILQFMQQQH